MAGAVSSTWQQAQALGVGACMRWACRAFWQKEEYGVNSGDSVVPSGTRSYLAELGRQENSWRQARLLSWGA